LPSPTLPVLADFRTASTTWSTRSLRTATSMRVFGTKSTTYSAPRYNSVWPRWRPKPLTSVTVMPETPMSDSAARTSSSLNGLIMAVTSFMSELPSGLALYKLELIGLCRHVFYAGTYRHGHFAVFMPSPVQLTRAVKSRGFARMIREQTCQLHHQSAYASGHCPALVRGGLGYAG